MTRGRNDLRPHQIASIAIGVDERVRSLEKIGLKTSLRGKHPRLSGSLPDRRVPVEGRVPIETIRWEGGRPGRVRMIDQTLLPGRLEVLEVESVARRAGT